MKGPCRDHGRRYERGRSGGEQRQDNPLPRGRGMAPAPREPADDGQEARAGRGGKGYQGGSGHAEAQQQSENAKGHEQKRCEKRIEHGIKTLKNRIHETPLDAGSHMIGSAR